MSVLPRQRLVIRAMAGAAVLALGLTGCAGEPTEIGWPGGTPPPPQQPAAAQPSATPDATDVLATEEILTLLHDFREAEVASYADPQPAHIARLELSPYMADPLLSENLARLHDMYEGGLVFEGRPTWQPAVADLRLDETPPTATVRDCVDATDWQVVFQDSGSPVPGDAIPDQYVEWLEVKLYDEGWLVHQAGMEGEAVQC